MKSTPFDVPLGHSTRDLPALSTAPSTAWMSSVCVTTDRTVDLPQMLEPIAKTYDSLDEISICKR